MKLYKLPTQCAATNLYRGTHLNVTAITTLVREMLRSDQVYDQLDELRSGTTTRLTNAQAAAIAKAGIDATRLGASEARKVAEALLAKSNADPRKTDGQRPPRGNRPSHETTCPSPDTEQHAHNYTQPATH